MTKIKYASIYAMQNKHSSAGMSKWFSSKLLFYRLKITFKQGTLLFSTERETFNRELKLHIICLCYVRLRNNASPTPQKNWFILWI